ncbi:MAG: cell envelope integrity protein CreD [Terracidiphilus sp.]|jgi:inner membrane protein
MGDLSILQAGLQAGMMSRSMGVKLIVVCALALMMTIPAVFVAWLVGDRTRRAKDVANEISSYVGGQQTFLGPTLAVPYDIAPQSPAETAKHGTYLVFPAQATANVKTHTEERHRALFKVPVFNADLNLAAAFDLTGVPSEAPQGAQLDWSRAEILVGVSDARGALADALLTMNGKATTLVPAESAADLTIGGDQDQQTRLTLFGVTAAGVAKPNAQFSVTSVLRFSGAQRIAVLAYGKTTHLTEEGDWPNPGFEGGSLPVSRSIGNKGFSAEWTVPYIARGVRAEGQSDGITGLGATALGVSFVELVDPYQSVNRSLKYVPLFLGLVFLSYFIFEVTTCKRVHPAQYVLVGVGQLIFYLLLLSLAERTGFDFGFLVAGVATVTLLAANAGWIFASRKEGIKALTIFALLYALIYMLLRLEDNALLVGAIASFVAIAAVMYFTRKIDWYSSIPVKGVPGEAINSMTAKGTS